MGKSYQRKTRRSKRKRESLPEGAVSVETADGQARFQRVLPMKWEIQQQIRKEFAGLPEDQAREIQMRQVAEDPILGPLYKQLASAKTSAAKQ